MFFHFYFEQCVPRVKNKGSEKKKRGNDIPYVVLSLLSGSLLSSGPDTIFRSPDLLITAVICEKSTGTMRA